MRRKYKCCKDNYCSFPAWHNNTCLFCGANCKTCDYPTLIDKTKKGDEQ